MYANNLTQIGLKTEFALDWRQLRIGYFKMLLCCLAGNMLPFVVILGLGGLCMLTSTDFFLQYVGVKTQGAITKAIASFLSKYEENMLTVTAVISFLLGFGAAAWSIRNMARQLGSNFRQALSLNLDSLNGSWIKAVSLAASAVTLSIGVEFVIKKLLPLPQATDKAAEMIAALSWSHLVAMILLATIAAPFFEEVVFRGFAYGGVRSTLHKRAGFSESSAHWIASVFSSVLFAVAHYNNITGTLVIFVLSLIMTELYRRSGSLWCPIIAHAMNNSIGVALIFLG